MLVARMWVSRLRLAVLAASGPSPPPLAVSDCGCRAGWEGLEWDGTG